jgi:hypothetical protein
MAFAGRDNLRVVLFHCGRYHHCIGALHIFCCVADSQTYALFSQATRGGRCGKIGAAHLVALIGQYLGDAAHAGAADADEMDAFDFMFHW